MTLIPVPTVILRVPARLVPQSGTGRPKVKGFWIQD